MLNCTERNMRDAVNENNLIRFCQELVRIPTVNPYSGDKNPSGEGEGLTYIADYCRGYGAEIIRIPCDDACCDRRDLLCPGAAGMKAGKVWLPNLFSVPDRARH